MSIADFGTICGVLETRTFKLACISDVASMATTVMRGTRDEYGGEQLCVECVTIEDSPVRSQFL